MDARQVEAEVRKLVEAGDLAGGVARWSGGAEQAVSEFESVAANLAAVMGLSEYLNAAGASGCVTEEQGEAFEAMEERIRAAADLLDLS